MKSYITPWILLLAPACFLQNLDAADKPAAGPKGGRLLAGGPSPAEFCVNADRRGEITFYDANLKPVAPGEQSVEAIAEAKTGRTVLQFERKDDALVSKSPLPKGHGFLVVVRITPKPGDKTRNFRIPFHEGTCGGCNLAEYACTCDHSADDDGHHH
jgi:hypothetical protein